MQDSLRILAEVLNTDQAELIKQVGEDNFKECDLPKVTGKEFQF